MNTASPPPVPQAQGRTRAPGEDCSTIEVAHRLGLAVRSVQLMVDRGELQAWKTPGGHRRIARASVERWLAGRQAEAGQGGAALPQPGAQAAEAATAVPAALSAHAAHAAALGTTGPAALATGALAEAGERPSAAPRVLLIEDSRHFQKLVSLLVQQHFPGVELHLADDGISGLAQAGQLQPQVLLVDLLLPGIDGATLIAGLRSHPAFASMRLVVVTSLDSTELRPYAHALQGLPVVHKPQLVAELPLRLAEALAGAAAAAVPQSPARPRGA